MLTDTHPPGSSGIIPFAFEGAPVRTVVLDGAPHFVGNDVAERLGYADPTNAIKQHCKGVVKRHPLQTAGGMQDVRVLAEPDVLRLIIRSQLPAADRFERWVFEEVLPSIRRTGGYQTPNLSRDVASAFEAYFGVAKLIGLDTNQSALSAGRAARVAVGENPLETMGITHLLAPQQELLLTATDIGKRLGGKSAIAVNHLLQERGFQTGLRDLKERTYWEPTETGKPYAVMLDTAKKHSDGTPIRQVKWLASVVDVLAAEVELPA